MKRKKQQADIIDKQNEDDAPSSCQTRRRIEDLHEMRRYQDELGLDEALDLA